MPRAYQENDTMAIRAALESLSEGEQAAILFISARIEQAFKQRIAGHQVGAYIGAVGALEIAAKLGVFLCLHPDFYLEACACIDGETG